MENIQPLPPHSRWMLHSRMLSFIIIHSFYSRAEENLFVHRGNVKAGRWYYLSKEQFSFQDTSVNAFYQNLQVLIREIKNAGAEVVLVPFIYNSRHDFNEIDSLYLQGIRQHNLWLNEFEEKFNVTKVDLRNSDITSSDYWVDDCHLNAEGDKQKAERIAPAIVSAMLRKCN